MIDLLWALAAILVGIWLLGFVFAAGVGNLIHLLLVVAVVAVLARLVLGRSVA